MIDVSVSLKDIFESHVGGFEADKALFKKICVLEAGFVNKRQEHIEFFGGTLTGVHRVYFLQEDRDKLMIEILGIDEDAIRDQIVELPDINKDWKVSTDSFNHACIWLMHKFSHSKHLSENERTEAQIRIAMYLNYRFLTSIMNNMFRYPANPDTARATYEQMSMKFTLKATGSWGAAIRYRAEALVSRSSIWRNAIDRYDNDYEIVKLLNDVQGAIKSMMIFIYGLFIQVHNQGNKIATSSSVIETDGEMNLRDRTKNISTYVDYIGSVIPDTHSFIRKELVDIVLDVVPTVPQNYFSQFLNWFSANYNHSASKDLENLVELIMEHSFEYLSKNNNLLKHKEDIASILIKLRGTYTSSRATDQKLMTIKKVTEDLIFKVTKSRNSAGVASVRTAFCLYLLIRAYTKKHYAG